MSNKWKFIIYAATMVLISFSTAVVNADVDLSRSSLTIEYIDIKNLTGDEHKKIIYQSPGEYATHSKDEFKLIYAENKKTIEETGEAPDKKDGNIIKEIEVESKKENKLPDTGERSSNIHTILGIVVLLILLLIYYILHNNKKFKNLTFLLLIGIGCFTPLMANASTLSYLLPSVKKTIDLNQTNSIDTPTINEYNYIGYIHEYEDNEKKINEEFGIVTVSYVDEAGTSILESETLKGKVNTSYRTEAKIIEGYSLRKAPENSVGYFKNSPQIITYVYVKDSPGEILIKYIDEDGREISDSSKKYGKIGDSYEEIPIDIDGYELKDISGKAKGTYIKEKQVITFIYKKIISEAKLIIKFVDYDGNPFVIPDLSDYDMTRNEGAVETLEDNIDSYYTKLRYNGTIFKQKSEMTDVILPVQLGDKYDLPDKLIVDILNPLGTKVVLFNSKNYEYIREIEGYSDDSSGTIQSDLTIVTYRMSPVIFGLA